MHPTVGTWDVYRLISLEDCENEVAASEGGSDFSCPLEFPIGYGKKKDVQENYFLKLHCGLLHGNGFLPGAQDHTFNERRLKYYVKELKCLYAFFLDDKQDEGPCGGLPSQFGERQIKWEATCMSAQETAHDAMQLMDDDEKNYYYRMKRKMTTSQAFETYLTLNGEKELMCMQIKLVDDSCGAFKDPRLLTPKAAQKLLKPREKDSGKGLPDPMQDAGR